MVNLEGIITVLGDPLAPGHVCEERSARNILSESGTLLFQCCDYCFAQKQTAFCTNSLIQMFRRAEPLPEPDECEEEDEDTLSPVEDF